MRAKDLSIKKLKRDVELEKEKEEMIQPELAGEPARIQAVQPEAYDSAVRETYT